MRKFLNTKYISYDRNLSTTPLSTNLPELSPAGCGCIACAKNERNMSEYNEYFISFPFHKSTDPSSGGLTRWSNMGGYFIVWAHDSWRVAGDMNVRAVHYTSPLVPPPPRAVEGAVPNISGDQHIKYITQNTQISLFLTKENRSVAWWIGSYFTIT